MGEKMKELGAKLEEEHAIQGAEEKDHRHGSTNNESIQNIINGICDTALESKRHLPEIQVPPPTSCLQHPSDACSCSSSPSHRVGASLP
jgi:hypothetical protein